MDLTPGGDAFLLDADLNRVPGLVADTLVIGTGVAGLSAALAAARTGRVLVVSKAEAVESATTYAQGGVAVALSPLDDPARHAADTLDVACGLADPAAVGKLVAEGPVRVRELIAAGAVFDREGGELAFGTEGGHTRARVLHASGDATGREIGRALIAATRAHPRITFLERWFCADLLHAGGEVFGAVFASPDGGALLQVQAPAVVLATGGAGQLYRETTNPEVATGDGVALAWRAGAQVADVEFFQFHPTTLYLPGARRFLISEAVRGEGGILVNGAGERFMRRYDPRGELAPRDVVSRAIVSELGRTGEAQVWLDLSPIPTARLEQRFPHILAVCEDYGIDPRKQRVPVRPSAHYFMGGVSTDLACRTSVEGLLACGEVASVGIHGANRLASNSLLEGLVYGHAAGLTAAGLAERRKAACPLRRLSGPPVRKTIPLDVEDVARSLKSLMWRAAGLLRRGDELEAALEQLRFWERYVYQGESRTVRGFELKNMVLVGDLIIQAALARKETRGAHVRLDYPERDDARFGRRFVFSRGTPLVAA